MAEPLSKRRRPHQTDDEVSTEPKKRKRAALACEECRVRKRRCDGAVPACGGCTKRMTSCVYLAELQEKAWQNKAQSSMIQTLRARLKQLEQSQPMPTRPSPQAIICDVEHEAEQLPPRPSSPPPPPPRSPRTDSYLPGNSEPGGLHTNYYDNDNLINSPPYQGSSTPRSSAGNNNSGGQPSALTTNDKSSFVGIDYPETGIEPCSVERLMRPINQAIGQAEVHSRPPATKLHGASSSSYGNSLGDCSCVCLLRAAEWSLPLRREADDLIDLFFSRVHRIYPILHQRTFMRQYEQLWEPTNSGLPTWSRYCSGLCRQRSRGKTFPSMVNAVFAMASLFESNTPEKNASRAANFFRTTQKIDLLDIIDEEVGIELVQLLLLMGFYLQSTENFSKCWNITGLAIRMAQNMGLQLSTNDAQKKGLLMSSATQLESEMRSRVWYGCVLLDREISMSFGRPLMITTGCDISKLPEAIDDIHLSEEAGKWNSQPCDRPSLLGSYINTINLYSILGQVLDREELTDLKLTRVHSAPNSFSETCPDTQSLLNLDTMIMEWRDSLPRHLHYDGTSDLGGQGHTPVMENAVLPHSDFIAQAKRLHTRFLHVRVLILRPALEHIFEKQRRIQPSTSTQATVARVQDLMLSNIAAQCVLSAHSLVQFLDVQIRSQSLTAWWYNISYLHTCGSTLLMGQLCTFTDLPIERESLAASWNLCLQCISRYTGVSSIAKKSFHLLQESAKRLRPEKGLQEGPGKHPIADSSHNPNFNESQNLCKVTQNVTLTHDETAHTLEHELPPSAVRLDSQPQPVGLLHDLDPVAADMEGFETDTWSTDPLGTSYWPFMPFLSQLETLPDFDAANTR